jgi:hypothetical protein
VPSVDQILCDPDLRGRFDQYSTSLLRDVDAYELRLALLSFRKSGRFSSVQLADVTLPKASLHVALSSLDPDDVPATPGLYRLTCNRAAVYLGGTLNLRARISSHIQAAGSALIPPVWPFEISGTLRLEVFRAPAAWHPRRIEAVARKLRISQRPALNLREFGVAVDNNDCLLRFRACAG